MDNYRLMAKKVEISDKAFSHKFKQTLRNYFCKYVVAKSAKSARKSLRRIFLTNKGLGTRM